MKIDKNKNLFLIVVMLFLFGACVPSGPAKKKSSDAQESELTFEDGPSVKQVICSAGSVRQVSCFNEVANAEAAMKEVICSSDGTYEISGQCIIQECSAGFIKQNGLCQKKNLCTPGSSLVQPCALNGAKRATRIAQCTADGTGMSFTSCQAVECKSGYQLSNGSCLQQINNSTAISQICQPNTTRQTSCTHEIVNAHSALKNITCSSDGNSEFVGSCLLQTCQTGYNKQGNLCVKSNCTPNQEQKINCQKPNASLAQFTRTCNSTGSSFSDSICLAISCQVGYKLEDGSCVSSTSSVCTPNQKSQINCTMANALQAQLTRTCNSDGSAFSDSACMALSCQSGYELKGGSCLAISSSSTSGGVYLDASLFDPDLDDDKKWIVIDDSFTEEVSLGKQASNESSPVKLQLRLVNESNSAMTVKLNTPSKNFQINIPNNVPATSEDIIEIYLKSINPGEIREQIEFSFGSETYILKLHGEII